MTTTFERSHPSFLIWILLVVVAALIALQAVPAVSHAVLKHGNDAVIARQCTDGRNGYLFFNPETNRYGRVCDLGNAWGVVITEGDREITAFLKNKMKSFEQVAKYMKNAGYELMQ